MIRRLINLLDRVSRKSIRIQRLKRLYGTPAASLTEGQIGLLELVELASEDPGLLYVYDIGAHIGTFSLLAKSVLPRAEVHAFEPLPTHWAEFESQTASSKNVKLHKVALGSTTWSIPMQLVDRSDASSLLELNDIASQEYGICQTGVVDVNVVTLEQYAEDYCLPAPHLVKLDVQGYELEILKGFGRFLNQCNWIICEISFEEYYKKQALYHDIASFLQDHGFQSYAFGFGTPVCAPLTQIDVLFRRSVGRVSRPGEAGT